MKIARTIFDLLKQTYREWQADRAPRLAAALAYYTVFSIAPLLIVVIAVAGLVFGEQAARGEIEQTLQETVGEDAAGLVDDLLENANRPREGLLSTLIGVGTLLLGALGAFEQFQNALNTIWRVQEGQEKKGLWGTLRYKLLSFGMVLVVGFLLLVSLVVSAVVAAVSEYATGILPGTEMLIQLANVAISFGFITLLFALIFKVLPDTKIEWRDVWVGAAVTALLFTLGKFLLGLYLGRSSTASAYGAAGALVVILLWIYYSAQIVLFGAEFTQVFAKRFGSKADEPTPIKPPLPEQEPTPELA